jgi:hypothetical protein
MTPIVTTSSNPSSTNYNQIANYVQGGIAISSLLLLPGWWKLAGLVIVFTGIPGPTFPDGTPIFRPLFYGFQA